MQRYDHFSEKAVLEQEFIASLYRFGDDILKFYLNHGFEALTIMLKIELDWQRKLLFDFLMFEKDAASMCITENTNFFLRLIAEGEGKMIPKILGISENKYNSVWKKALNLLKDLFHRKILEEKLFNLACSNYFSQAQRNKFLGNSRNSRSINQDSNE